MPDVKHPHGKRTATALVAATLLAGCAGFSPDGGFGTVERSVQQHAGQAVTWQRDDDARRAAAERVAALLREPLTMDAAVQVMLLNHRGLQAEFAQLGITEAELVQAGRLPNPGFGFGRSRQGDEREIERGLHLSLGRLIAMPLMVQVEQRRFAQAQGAAAMHVLERVAGTRRAWVQAVAATESVRYARQVMEAAEASAELARRMAAVGNFSPLQRLREQAFYADAALGLARAEQAERSARERLVRQLGLWGTQTAFSLPERLPALPEAPREQPDIERLAIEQRLDVQGARLAVEQTAKNLGLTRATRFVNVLELGLMRNASNEAPTQTGWEIGFEIPLFDGGGARVARAEAVYLQAVHRAAQTAIDARSEVREAYGHYRSSYDIARHHRDELVPLKTRISEENLLRYNGMFIGVFELLADARMQIAGVAASIDALRDFWLAQVDLDQALIGKPGPAAALGAALGGAVTAPAGGEAPH